MIWNPRSRSPTFDVLQAKDDLAGELHRVVGNHRCDRFQRRLHEQHISIENVAADDIELPQELFDGQSVDFREQVLEATQRVLLQPIDVA